MKTLPDNSKLRTQYPVVSGCIAYFPAALAGVARHSYIGGAKYNDGGLVHLRYLSNQHLDCIGRHILDMQDLIAAQARGVDVVPTLVYNFELKKEEWQQLPIAEAILIEANALAWRSLAVSQEMHEKYGERPLAPAARTEPPPAPYKPIRITSFGSNKVGTVKAIREVGNYPLKESVDIVNGLPNEVDYTSDYTREEALKILRSYGATVE